MNRIICWDDGKFPVGGIWGSVFGGSVFGGSVFGGSVFEITNMAIKLIIVTKITINIPK